MFFRFPTGKDGLMALDYDRDVLETIPDKKCLTAFAESETRFDWAKSVKEKAIWRLVAATWLIAW